VCCAYWDNFATDSYYLVLNVVGERLGRSIKARLCFRVADQLTTELPIYLEADLAACIAEVRLCTTTQNLIEIEYSVEYRQQCGHALDVAIEWLFTQVDNP